MKISTESPIIILCILFLTLILPACNQEKNESIAEKAARIHEKVLTVDSHVDTPMRLTHSGFDIGKRHDVKNGKSRVDFPRMKDGGLDAIFFAILLDRENVLPKEMKK